MTMSKSARWGCAVLLSGGIAAGCQSAPHREVLSADNRVIEDTLRSIVLHTFQDIEAKNADGALRPMSTDVIFVGDGLMITGRDSLLRLTTRAFSEWHTVKAEVKITRVEVLAPDAAIVNWESHVDATDMKGGHTPYGGLVTAVFVKRNGQWQIIQQQQCAPMPPEVPTNMKPSSKAIPES